MGLFTPAWNNENKEKRMKAVEKTIAKNDEKKLAKIAIESKYSDTRGLSIPHITNQSTLENIAKNDDNPKNRSLAIEKISDEDVLVDIAKNDENLFTRESAIKKIKNESDLVNIAKNDSNWSIQRLIIEKINNEFNLMELAKDIENLNIFSLIIEKINDDALLMKIIDNNENFNICKLAIEKINDESLLMDISINNKNFEIRKMAVEKLKFDEEKLKKIAFESYGNSAEVAIDYLKTQSIIEDIAINADNQFTQGVAIGKLNDINLLKDIYQNNMDFPIQKTVLLRILQLDTEHKEENFYVDVVKNARHAELGNMIVSYRAGYKMG